MQSNETIKSMTRAQSYPQIKKELASHARPDKARLLQSFFKTGPGQYGEGDIFIGVTVPETRSVAKSNLEIDENTLNKLLQSPIHEERLLALVIWVLRFKKADQSGKKSIFQAYLKSTKHINNWDLVDLSAPSIVGAWLLDKDKSLLYKLAKSKLLWERRIAIVSTYSMIKNGDFEPTIKICEMLLGDKEDLMHKACGWMLREVAKKDKKVLEIFLEKHIKNMPRTMLRYAIERFPEKERKAYLQK